MQHLAPQSIHLLRREIRRLICDVRQSEFDVRDGLEIRKLELGGTSQGNLSYEGGLEARPVMDLPLVTIDGIVTLLGIGFYRLLIIIYSVVLI